MPFPFVEAPRLRDRPALIISRAWQGDGFRLYWTAMVTSIRNAGWPDDVVIGDLHHEAGLPVPSVIRPAKVATIMEGSARRLGRLREPILQQVLAIVRRRVRLDSPG